MRALRQAAKLRRVSCPTRRRPTDTWNPVGVGRLGVIGGLVLVGVFNPASQSAHASPSLDVRAATGPAPEPKAWPDREAERPPDAEPEPGTDPETEPDPYRSSWIGGGAPFSTKETSLGFGALALYSFFLHESPETRPSSLSLRVAYTVRNQTVVAFEPRLFLKDSRYSIQGQYEFRFFPNRFYGLGNQAPDVIQDYTERRVRASTEFQWQLRPDVYLGARYEFDRLEVLRLSDAPTSSTARGLVDYLDSGVVPGAQGETLNGSGAALIIDDRDSVFSATRGRLYRAEITAFPEFAGTADTTFAKLRVDLRNYIKTFSPKIAFWDERRSQVFALHLYGEYVAGDPPFQALPTLGGPRRMRGYFRGRYRDNYYTAGQVEYRAPILWRIDVTAFAAVAHITGPSSTGGEGRLTYATGGGLRALVDVEKRTMVRIDFGIADSGDVAIIFGRSEAF